MIGVWVVVVQTLAATINHTNNMNTVSDSLINIQTSTKYINLLHSPVKSSQPDNLDVIILY